MSLTAYIRYDNHSRIVPGGPIVTSVKPKVGDWVAVDDVLVITTSPNYKLRAFVRYIKNGDYVAGSLILQHNVPQDGKWKEVYFINPACCPISTTTTTTTQPVTTTTTTTTAIQYYNVYGDVESACFNTDAPFIVPLIFDSNVCSTGIITLVSGTYADYGIPNGSTLFINLENGNVIEVQVFGSSATSFGCTSCG